MASIIATPILPGRGLGVFSLGTSLYDNLRQLKDQPQAYPAIEILYSTTKPITSPITLHLSKNGLRLRFDGPDQRLRLVEVLDFDKLRLTYKGQELVKKHDGTIDTGSGTTTPAGPSFRHIYHKLFGLTYAGEYLGPEVAGGESGTYILSYPGVAFSFPLEATAWNARKDHVALLSSSAASPASSLAIFEQQSWPEARSQLFDSAARSLKSGLSPNRAKDAVTDDIEFAKVHSGEEIELIRRSSASFRIRLGETTVQDLITELGPPDSIYTKIDRRLSIHRARTIGEADFAFYGPAAISNEESTDTDFSSTYTGTDDSGGEGDDGTHKPGAAEHAEYFYNYYRYGFDVLISKPVAGQQGSLATRGARLQETAGRLSAPAQNVLAATKILLHGNVPGSHAFNRHRRLRWSLADVEADEAGQSIITSEMPFRLLSGILQKRFSHLYADLDEQEAAERKMVLDRGSEDSPGSSCEFLGGWEDSQPHNRQAIVSSGQDDATGNSELHGYPGLIFEVLKNDVVCCVTVY